MFDIVGRRRWFYAFSLLIMIPGMIFILLTPLTGGKAGLKFSIDFTGGTVWEVHFRRRDAQPADVHLVMPKQGLPGTVAITTAGGKDYVLIRTEQIGLTELSARRELAITGPAPGAEPGAQRLAPAASGLAAAIAQRRATCAAGAPAHRPDLARLHRQARRDHRPANQGELADLRFALEDAVRPDRRGAPGGQHRPGHQRRARTAGAAAAHPRLGSASSAG